MKHVYLMPGMAASPDIFEYIKLPEDQFTIHLLDWFIPGKDETLQDYSKRLLPLITHERPVLIGVSFGGVIVQEIAQLIEVEQLIIISSIKSTDEFPRRMRFSRLTQFHKILPTFLVEHVEWLFKYNMGIGQKKLVRYSRYLNMRSNQYLKWAFDTIVNWQHPAIIPGIVHIHGADDVVFPIKYIKDCIVVPDAGHAAIITHAKWFNNHLPEILNRAT